MPLAYWTVYQTMTSAMKRFSDSLPEDTPSVSGSDDTTDHRPSEGSQDRIMRALRDLSIDEQKLFVAALDQHAAGECDMEEALSGFVRAVLEMRGARVQ